MPKCKFCSKNMTITYSSDGKIRKEFCAAKACKAKLKAEKDADKYKLPDLDTSPPPPYYGHGFVDMLNDLIGGPSAPSPNSPSNAGLGSKTFASIMAQLAQMQQAQNRINQQKMNMAQQMINSYGVQWKSSFQRQPMSWDIPEEEDEVMKEVRVCPLYNETIYEIHFITIPRRGWFAKNIAPVIEIIKNMIPATGREYDPTTFKWQIAAEYWPALKQIFESSDFKISMVKPSEAGPKVHVPEDYAENFYHKAQPATQSDTKESVAAQLAALLGIHEDFATMELVELKKKYRAMARILHPDLGGDAKKMSELNRLWSIYNLGDKQ